MFFLVLKKVQDSNLSIQNAHRLYKYTTYYVIKCMIYLDFEWCNKTTVVLTLDLVITYIEHVNNVLMQ